MIECVAIADGCIGNSYYREGETVLFDPAHVQVVDGKKRLPMWLIQAKFAKNEDMIERKKEEMMKAKYLVGMRDTKTQAPPAKPNIVAPTTPPPPKTEPKESEEQVNIDDFF